MAFPLAKTVSVKLSLPKMVHVACLGLWVGGTLATASASNLVEVLPVTNRMLMLHFDDGSVTYHGREQPLTADRVDVSPLATGALAIGAFTVSCSTDPDYAAGRHPVRLGRKSKGTEYAHHHTDWIAGFGFRPSTPYAASEHWIYLELPAALDHGSTYTITWNASALNTATGTGSLLFDEAVTRSETVHVNLVGYAPAAPQKFGYLYHWAGDLGGLDLQAWVGRPFRVVRTADGMVAYSGTVAFRRPANQAETGQTSDTPNRNFLGAAVWECDFSDLSTPGEYRLVVPGIGCSFPFRIDRDVYREAFHLTMRGLFQNRSGLSLAPPHADEVRPAPHNPRPVAEGGTPGFQNRLKYTTTRFCDILSDGGGAADKAAIEAGAKGNLTTTWGWYQDAGDWDGYVSHIDIPIGLLLLYQLHPEKFADGELNIPESGNGIPDLVDEGAWLPRFFQRQRAELMARGWGTGGVGARVFGDFWGSDRPGDMGRGSWQDTDRDWYVTGEDPFSSYRYAATAAQLAEILQTLGVPDPEGIDWAAEAVSTYAWAAANTRAGDESKSPHGTLKDNRALAAAALYRLTGTAGYHTQLQSDLADVVPTLATLDGARLSAVVLYLSMPSTRAAEAGLVTRMRGALKASALNVSTYSADQRACRWGGNFFMPMLIGQPTTPLIQPAILGQRVLSSYDANAAADVLRVCYTTADYFLGCNPLNSTWITGLGERYPLGVFCLDDQYAGPTPRRGMTPYGPWKFPEAWTSLRMAVSVWWAWDTTYPSIDPRGPGNPAAGAVAPGTWPGHEAWFDNRNSPQGGEFTVWQNNLPNALTYGFLAADISRPPTLHSTPSGGVVMEGHPLTLGVGATDADPIHYQWRRNGTPIVGAHADTLVLPAMQSFQTGSYDVVVTGAHGSVTSAAAEVTVIPVVASSDLRAVNISTRAFCGAGAEVLIPGFVIQGEGTRTLLIRAVGPRLADYGVTHVLADPVLQLERISAPAGRIVSADDWMTDGDRQRIVDASAAVGAFPLDGRASGGRLDSTSAAVVVELSAGIYTPICRGKNGSTGVAIVEIYDAGGTGSARLVNLSNRGFVGTDDQVMIPGFVVSGGGARSYLVRAAGPALGAFGVPGFLPNPQIRVVASSSGAVVASNDDWQGDPNTSDAMVKTFAAVGAFPFADTSRDAALRITVPPGLYTVVCRGFSDTSGIALVEVYELPD